MRRWFFVLLIMLLPLRGWVGDAMAMQMAMQGQHAPASGAMLHADGDTDPAHSHVNSVVLAAADDCAGQTGAQDTGDAMDAEHCEACAMCQSCHTVAVLLPELAAAAQVSPESSPTAVHVFASADRAPLVKPPIH